MPTALTIVTDALQDLGVLDATQAPEAADLDIGLRRLNQLIGRLATHRLVVYEVRREVFNLSTGVAAYTVGPAATWNTQRPIWLELVSFILDRTAAQPVELQPRKPWTLQEWQAIPVKSITGPVPEGLFYDNAYSATGQATITVYPVPSNAVAQAVLYVPRVLSAFTNTSTNVALPDGYELMLVKQLALLLQRPFGRTADPGLMEEAREALDDVKRANWRPRLRALSADALAIGGGAVGRGYNIYTDES